MDTFQSSVMVALLPTTSDWCHIALPHLTLVYAGEIQDLKATDENELAKTALALAMTCPPLMLDVLTKDVLGAGEEQVDTLLLRPTPQLLAMRSVVESWNASQYKTFKPHVTVGPVGSASDVIPDYLIFDRIMLGWGDKQLTYRFMVD